MRILIALLVLLALAASIAVGVLRYAAEGGFGEPVVAGMPADKAVPATLLADRAARQDETARALDVSTPSQILFGDLHVHSSFSVDAFQLTLPMAGGEGRHPVADACDFARFCSQLDFWSINDHAASLSPRRWRETIDTIRRCDAIAGAGSDTDERDLVSFLGWEWTQMGSRPDNHYGHKNVVLRDLDDAAIPARPIAARPPAGVPSTFDTGQGGALLRGLGAFAIADGHDMMATLAELQSVPACPDGVPVRDLPADCAESAATPGDLFAKLDDWGMASTVIPHGTTWGIYTPPGSSWTKQLTPEQHDADRQRLIEIYSGHGNAEEYRDWRAVRIAPDGSRSCPLPGGGYVPSCWRAGEIVRERCLADAAEGDRTSDIVATCDARAVLARQHFVDADRNAGPWTVPGLRPHELGIAGQCTDCFQPAFNYRPLGSVQAILALGRPDAPPGARRFRFGFIASSDSHTARAGTGYKEVHRREFTDARMAEVGRSPLVTAHARPPAAYSEPFPIEAAIPSVAFLEAERSGAFFFTGGLAAVHAPRRDRDAIFAALERRETYGTSGPRILLWFDLLDPDAPGGRWPMGSEVAIADTPTFRVRAAGSFEQAPGCPDAVSEAIGAERIAALCLGECLHPSDRRRPITRIEVVRLRQQTGPEAPLAPLIEDPWRRFECPGDPAGCEVVFSDPEFAKQGRETAYYVRAIETASPTIDADPLGCDADASGACITIDSCFDRPDDDDCLAPSEHRAWSSPIYVDPRPPAGALRGG